MTYQQFKGKHAGENILVVGCGESATLLAGDHDKLTTIGVNDIDRLFTPTYTVVVNDKMSFAPGRWEHIENCESAAVFTHFKKPGQIQINHSDRVVTIPLGRYAGTNLGEAPVDFTSNSPYIAVIIAAWMGAKNIGILGVDWTTNHFFQKTGDHPLMKKLPTIVKEYNQLAGALSNRGVGLYNLSPVSKLDITRMHLNDFLLL